MKQSNVILGLVFVGLAAAVYFLLAPAATEVEAETTTKLFQEEDWSNTTEVVIKDQNGTIQLRNSPAGWQWSAPTNANLPTKVDADRVSSLQNLLTGIEKYRKGSSASWDESKATSVVLSGKELLLSSKQDQTFLKEGNEVWELRIPGYNVFIQGFFNSDPRFWASKEIANSNWQTLKSVRVRRQDEDLVNLTSTDEFFAVEGLNAIDSAKVFNYVNLLRGLKGKAWLPSGQELGDLLGSVAIADIKKENNAELTFYDLEVDERIAVKRGDYEALMVDSEVLKLLFISSDSLR